MIYADHRIEAIGKTEHIHAMLDAIGASGTISQDNMSRLIGNEDAFAWLTNIDGDPEQITPTIEHWGSGDSSATWMVSSYASTAAEDIQSLSAMFPQLDFVCVVSLNGSETYSSFIRGGNELLSGDYEQHTDLSIIATDCLLQADRLHGNDLQERTSVLLNDWDSSIHHQSANKLLKRFIDEDEDFENEVGDVNDGYVMAGILAANEAESLKSLPADSQVKVKKLQAMIEKFNAHDPDEIQYTEYPSDYQMRGKAERFLLAMDQSEQNTQAGQRKQRAALTL